jgi:hypothetical protein
MATGNVNGVRLFYELSGTGEIPLVLVHGSWCRTTIGPSSCRVWPTHLEFSLMTIAATAKVSV